MSLENLLQANTAAVEALNANIAALCQSLGRGAADIPRAGYAADRRPPSPAPVEKAPPEKAVDQRATLEAAQAAQAAQAAHTPAPEETPKITREDMLDAMTAYSVTHGRDGVFDLLKTFGVDGFSALPAARYAEFLERLTS